MPSPWTPFGGGGSSDSVKVTDADLLAEKLTFKLLAGTGIAKEIVNPGGVEAIRLNVDAQTGDHKVMVSVDDTTPNYLSDKTSAGYGVGLTQLNDGADEALQINSSLRVIAHNTVMIPALSDVTVGPFTRVPPEIVDAVCFPNDSHPNDAWGNFYPNQIGFVSWVLGNNTEADPNTDFSMTIFNSTGSDLTVEYVIRGTNVG